MSASASPTYHHRSLSRDDAHSHSHPRPRSPSPPTQVHHPSLLPRSVPTPALVESVAGAAHYSGARVDVDSPKRQPSNKRASHTQVKADHHRLLADLKELYEGRPTAALLARRWRRDAVFEDPLVQCRGFSEYAAQWFALPKMYVKSETVQARVMSSTSAPNRLVFAQTQAYTYRLFGHKKIVESIIVVDLDGDDKIVRLMEQWDGKELPTRFGSRFLRRANATVMSWFIHVPKNKTGPAEPAPAPAASEAPSASNEAPPPPTATA